MKPFRFTPETLTSIELDAGTNTTRVPKAKDNYAPERPTPGENVIEWAARACIEKGRTPFDSSVLYELRKMDLHEIILAAKGYLPGELFRND